MMRRRSGGWRRARAAASALLAVAAALSLADCTGGRATGAAAPPGASPSATASGSGDVIWLPGNSYPSAMTLAADGSLWVTEEQICAVARIDPAGRITQFRVPDNASEPDGIVQTPDGAVWYTGFDQLARVVAPGTMLGWRSDRAQDRLGWPESITVGPDGAVWYLNTTGPAIDRIDSERGPTTVATLSDGRSPFPFSFPADSITSGPDHAVWFSELSESSSPDGIGRVTPQGAYRSWPLPPGTDPQTVVTGPDGALWFTEQYGIGRITTGGAVSRFPVAGTKHPHGITVGRDGALWFTTDTGVGRLSTAGHVTVWPVPGAQQLDSIVVDPRGGFWAADTKESVIRRFVPPASVG